MSAFATAATRIFADPNMAVDATWLPGGVPPGSTIRAIRKSSDELTSYGGARVWSETERIDEMAAESKADPVAFRLSLLADMPRHAAVLRLAADKAGWGAPPAAGRARGGS